MGRTTLTGLLVTYNEAVREVKVSLRLSLGYNQSMPPETKELIAKKANRSGANKVTIACKQRAHVMVTLSRNKVALHLLPSAAGVYIF